MIKVVLAQLKGHISDTNNKCFMKYKIIILLIVICSVSCYSEAQSLSCLKHKETDVNLLVQINTLVKNMDIDSVTFVGTPDEYESNLRPYITYLGVKYAYMIEEILSYPDTLHYHKRIITKKYNIGQQPSSKNLKLNNSGLILGHDDMKIIKGIYFLWIKN